MMDDWEEFIIIVVEIDWWLHDCLLTHLLFAGLVERPHGNAKIQLGNAIDKLEPD